MESNSIQIHCMKTCPNHLEFAVELVLVNCQPIQLVHQERIITGLFKPKNLCKYLISFAIGKDESLIKVTYINKVKLKTMINFCFGIRRGA